MKKKKEFKIESINYALYEARNKKKVTVKEAAKGLRISKLHLNLIEKGYVHVTKHLQPRFINYYHLKNVFFKNNTTYVTPVYVKYEDPHLEEKIRAKIKKRKTKIVSGIISLLLVGVFATGVYYYERDNVNPRGVWTSEFTTFREEFLKDNDGNYPSTEYPGDTVYYIGNPEHISDYCITMLGKDKNAAGLTIFVQDARLTASFSVYNQKKIIRFESNSFILGSTIYALCTYTKRHDYLLSKITIDDGEEIKDYGPDTAEYKYFVDQCLKEGTWVDRKIASINDVLSERYTKYEVDQLLDDAQSISAHDIFGFRLGFRLILASSILLILSLSVFIYSLIKGRKPRPKKVKPKPYVVHKTEYTADAALVYRSVPNDSKFPMIIPEFALRILALMALLLSSIGVVWLTQASLTGLESTKEAFVLNAYVSNLLVTGMTLAFFLKLDVYHKRSNRELVENILMLFVFGLIFYVAECITVASLSSQGTIYSSLIKLLSHFIPGNIIWNLMLYSMIFLFLFTLPKSLEDSPHKVLLWRLGSALPTLLLLAAFIFKGTFQGEISPYVGFLFHTNGVLLTAFAIFYLYSLFFFQQYVSLKYGREFEQVFLDSRRYALSKNLIACIVIVLLSLMDLLFYFKLPDNSLNLGNNWIIAILIPFILCYHPHIGKRAPKWDLAYNVLYVVFLIGGFLVSFSMISNTLDLSQIQQIIN